MRYSNHRLSSSPQPVRLAYIKGGAPSGSAGKGPEQAPVQPPDPPKSSDEFALLDQVRIGVLCGSILSALMGVLFLRLAPQPARGVHNAPTVPVT